MPPLGPHPQQGAHLRSSLTPLHPSPLPPFHSPAQSGSALKPPPSSVSTPSMHSAHPPLSPPPSTHLPRADPASWIRWWLMGWSWPYLRCTMLLCTGKYQISNVCAFVLEVGHVALRTNMQVNMPTCATHINITQPPVPGYTLLLPDEIEVEPGLGLLPALLHGFGSLDSAT